MEDNFNWKKFLILVIIIIILGIYIGTTYDKKQTFPIESAVPPKPDLTRPMYYDHSLSEWRYLYRGTPRAKGVDDAKGMSEDDLQKYLEKKIPGYREKTYWGEEYNEEDDEK